MLYVELQMMVWMVVVVEILEKWEVGNELRE
jgi:hypothetical protein